MKKFLQTVTSFLVAFAMIAAPVADAQTRGRQTNNSSVENNRPEKRSSSSSSRQLRGNGNSRPTSGNSRPSNNGHQRPSNNNGGQHPGNFGGGNQNNRPSQGNNHNRPSQGNNNRPSQGNRPGGGNQWNNNRPNNNHRPSNDVRPPMNNNHGGMGAHGPGFNNGHHGPSKPHPAPRPPKRHDAHFRHHVPFFGHYNRPVPPPRWHYHGGGPSFGTILGITLGTAISASINSLINSGYTVSSYGNDVVYLNNVPQMNYYWPEAALYYNNGMLYGSQFTYPSTFNDMTRYNNLYRAFTMQYGMPVQAVNQGGLLSATWYGLDNRFVTLSYSSQYGGGQFYTTLSFGN